MKVLIYIISIIFLLFVIIINIKPSLFLQTIVLVTPYKTQSIQYRNIQNPNITIQFQMKDIGARGYLKRTVIVKPGILWDKVNEINVNTIDKSKWYRDYKYINELKIKGG
ncbi:hypothetical protein CPU12_07375 [Malaciobacter molluscorum LMG 25693]|uniref:Uncharacterized protein n=1 Tax=Malaciobacter molluscorum LMG 25693 TaxID=870501 RepID=A0A2G1DHU5_9BACT|nr:hypothetical protein [Malaciobacter molluscorum]AXX93022.1 hypothetical protein AMOL_2068 [Malaciobacter molluscorum LMG 25693]PHO18079.1 hypothetical protein CPU12_07375 [Malaciobacter molluscorum LMG 25693]RXJ94864.1 hypothetical protein CRV00_05895 [Malaciobacter molluscorum]